MYKKLDYRKAKCFCPIEDHYQVEVLEVVDYKPPIWTGVIFHLKSDEADEKAVQLKDDLEHEKKCPNSIQWSWDSDFDLKHRREIDFWYNSLTKEQRSMIDDIIQDSRN